MSEAPNRRALLVGAIGGVAAAAVASRMSFGAAASASGLATATRAGMAFQTPVAVTIACPEPRRLEPALDAAFAGIRSVERAASIYRPDSALCRLNRDGRIDNPPHHMTVLMRYALRLAGETDGGYDPTVQPLWDLWARHHAQGQRPSDETLRAVLRQIDWRAVVQTTDSISFERPGMAVTLNSINQGYAADVVMNILADHGIVDAFVDTGEFGASGHHPSGRDWHLGVIAPRAVPSLAFTLDPFRGFAATSGDYKTYFSPDFCDHHIFNPKTGRSSPDWSSVTVVASSGLIADGLSTALFNVSPEQLPKAMAAYPACDFHVIDKAGIPYKVSV